MPTTDTTMFAARAAELIAVKAIQTMCLILALGPVPFIVYYIAELHLWSTDLQFILSAIALMAGICLLIYAGLRIMIWLLCAIVPVVVWLLYLAVHGMAWLLRTVIVPGILWLLSVALPIMATLFCAAVRDLTRRLRDKKRPLNTMWSGIYRTALSPQISLLTKADAVSRVTRVISRQRWRRPG